MRPAPRSLGSRVAVGFAAGYVLLHPLAMLLVEISPPRPTLSLSPLAAAFSPAHLPMGIVFGGVGSAIGLAHHWRVRAELARSRAEAVARHERERIDALVHLAGAVCHELGQPITAVMTWARMLEARLPPDGPEARHARSILEATGTMSDIVHRLQDLEAYETKPYLEDLLIVDLERSRRAPDRAPAGHAKRVHDCGGGNAASTTREE